MKEIKARGLYDTDINKHDVIRSGGTHTHTQTHTQLQSSCQPNLNLIPPKLPFFPLSHFLDIVLKHTHTNTHTNTHSVYVPVNTGMVSNLSLSLPALMINCLSNIVFLSHCVCVCVCVCVVGYMVACGFVQLRAKCV